MRTKKYTSASELAEMGYCEKKMLFEHRLGRRLSRDRVQARLDGLAAHEAFHQDAVKVAPDVHSSEHKPWCFIASELFGQSARETRVLRQFRDTVLRRYGPGRSFIGVYYRHSPGIARWLRRHSVARIFARALLRSLVFVLQWPVDRRSWRRKAGS